MRVAASAENGVLLIVQFALLALWACKLHEIGFDLSHALMLSKEALPPEDPSGSFIVNGRLSENDPFEAFMCGTDSILRAGKSDSPRCLTVR